MKKGIPNEDFCTEAKQQIKEVRKFIYENCNEEGTAGCYPAESKLERLTERFLVSKCPQIYPFEFNTSCAKAVELIFTVNEKIELCARKKDNCSHDTILNYENHYSKGLSDFWREGCYDRYKKVKP